MSENKLLYRNEDGMRLAYAGEQVIVPDGTCRVRNGAAVKFDQEKNRVDLLPIDALEEVAKVLTHGAKKYGERNWEKGMQWTRLFGAALRHLFAFARHKDLDDETGLPHLAHAGCCVLFLLAYHLRQVGEDNRP